MRSTSLNRLAGSLAILLLPPSLLQCGGQATHLGRVPVILISIDTLRSDRLPAYGYIGVETPGIDSFRRDSILFERVYSHCPLTLPSHASILTGLLPPDHGVRDNRGYRLSKAHRTLASYLREAGYRTAAVVSSMVLRRLAGLDQGFEFYDDDMKMASATSMRTFPQRSGIESSALAIRWLDQLGSGDKFFLFLHLYEPHSPRDAPEPYSARYRDPYDAEVAYTDTLVGRFLGHLKDRGIYDSSLIILTSDHGEGLGDHVETEHGLLIHREVLQVPLMIKLPGQERSGETVPAEAALVDIMPTILTLLDLPAPTLPGHALLTSEPHASERRVYSETYFPRHQYGWSELESVIEGRLHYIRAPKPEMYDLFNDPAERHNLLPAREVPSSLVNWIEEIGPGSETTAEESRDDMEKLASLGYVGGIRSHEDWRRLPDPKDHVREVEELWALVDRIGKDDDLKADARVLNLASTLGVRNEALYRAIAQNYLHAGRPEVARRLLVPYADSSDAATLVMLGKALTELGDLNPAQGCFVRALRSSEADPGAHLGLGIVHLRLGHLPLARSHLQAAVSGDPSPPEAWNGLGVVEAQSGDLSSALGHWRKAVELDPTLSETWFNLGLAYKRKGERPSAMDALERYIALVKGEERQRALHLIRELEGMDRP